MSATSRFLGLGVALGLAGGLLVGVGLTQPGRAAATTPSAEPSLPAVGVAIGAPALPPVVTSGGATTGTAVVSSGPAIAYPYFGGSPGVAPDHTIVVTGVGQADMQSDGSDRAAAQKAALVAALADAKAQATEIASATGLTISGVLSVSALVSPNYGVEPMAGSASASGQPTVVCGLASSGGASGGAQATPVPPVSIPACPPIYPSTLSASVTVEYGVH